MPKKIDWLNHILEFSVVLIGILIAFQLNKCSDGRSKSALIKNHTKYIYEECDENISRLNASISHSNAQLKYADSLIFEITKSKDIPLIKKFSSKLLNLQNISLKKDAYSVLVESGDIRYMKNFNNKRKIITLYESFNSIKVTNENILKIYDNHYYPYLKKNFDLVNWNYKDLSNVKEKEKYFSGEFGNIVSTYRFLLNSKIEVYSKCKADLNALKSDLKF